MEGLMEIHESARVKPNWIIALVALIAVPIYFQLYWAT